ncbi:four-helix bundle copper-binding protein [Muricoccus radiodurans]|uniref:four-helix bundle copper-binding protein n=1 Tax=Muricoccus radiodurans TaxID=2231721 RepID=UPI003CE9843A
MHHADMEACIQACLDCHRTCLATIAHCLAQGGHHTEKAHIVLMMDCAQLCATDADFMIRGSAHHARLCGVCAEVCEACAADCEKHGEGDAAMQACVVACRRCAAECRKMAA